MRKNDRVDAQVTAKAAADPADHAVVAAAPQVADVVPAGRNRPGLVTGREVLCHSHDLGPRASRRPSGTTLARP